MPASSLVPAPSHWLPVLALTFGLSLDSASDLWLELLVPDTVSGAIPGL